MVGKHALVRLQPKHLTQQPYVKNQDDMIETYTDECTALV